MIGVDKALLMLLTGDMIDAGEAEKIGLVTMVVPHDELEMATLELAEKLVKGPPMAIRCNKRAVYDGMQMSLEEALKNARRVVKGLIQTKDHEEGAKAFVEKREPVFGDE